MRFLPVSELKGGEVLAVNIMSATTLVLVREGSTLTHKLIDRLGKYGIKTVYIKDAEMEQYLKESFHKTIDEVVRNEAVNKIKTSFEKFEMRVNKEKNKKRYGDSGSELFQGLKNISKDLIDEVMTGKNSKISMIDIKNITDYHYEHSVSVAVLSLIIGTKLNLSLKQLEDLTYGALLIDIGCNWLDKDLMISEAMYTDKEMDRVKEHVAIGYDYIKDNTTFNAHIKSILMHHHERMDGSGYPKGLKGNEIHPLAKIVMIADVYDAMTSDRPHRPTYNQSEAFEYIMANAGALFDFEVVSIFATKVIPYPVGTYLLLSNHQKALVIENNDGYPLRPIVRTFGKSKYSAPTKFVLNLLEENNITIERVVFDLK